MDSETPLPPEEEVPSVQDLLVPKKNWVDEVSWYLMVMGFIAILAAGLCFILFRHRPLRYEDFSLDANVLGKYLLLAGLMSYAIGRILYYIRRYRRGKVRR